MRKPVLSAVVAAFSLGTSGWPAFAGRTYHGWLTSTETVSDGAVELQGRISEQNDKGDVHLRETSFWFAPAVGVTNGLEVTLPVEFSRVTQTGAEPGFTLTHFGAEARYRFAQPQRGFAELVRFALLRDVTIRNLVRGELDLALSYDIGPVQVLLNGGTTGEANRGGFHLELRPGAGVSVAIVSTLRLGVEGYAEVSLDPIASTWSSVGPNLAWSRGRFWVVASYGIGVYNIGSAPRLWWGITL